MRLNPARKGMLLSRLTSLPQFHWIQKSIWKKFGKLPSQKKMKMEKISSRNIFQSAFLKAHQDQGLGETWLEKGSEVHFDGYSGHFANVGKGKGVAAFSKILAAFP